MKSSSTEKATEAVIYALILSLFAYRAYRFGIDAYPLDDAYIVQHSAAGILAGGESRYLGSSPADGITSPAYIIILVALSTILPVAVAHWLLNTISALFLAAAYIAIGRNHNLNPMLRMGLALGTLGAGFSLYQIGNGLETGMAMAAVAWSIVAFDRSDEPPTWGYGLIAALPFVRPELAALSIALMAFSLMQRRPARPRHVAALFGCAAILTCLTLAILGTLIPGTIEAKSTFFSESCFSFGSKAKYTSLAAYSYALSLGLVALGFPMAAASPLWPVALTFALALLAAFTIKLPGAANDNLFRYMYVLLPFAALGWASTLGHRQRIVRITAFAMGGATLFAVMVTFPQQMRIYAGQLGLYAFENALVSEWVAQHVPADAVVLVHDAGRISLAGKQKLVDFVGLKSPSSVEIHRRANGLSCGYRDPRAISDIAKNSGASYLVAAKDWDDEFKMVDSLLASGWRVERIDDRQDNAYYRVYRIHLPPS